MRATLTVATGIRDGWLGTSAVRAARSRIKDVARHTPVLTSRSLSDQCGGTVVLKAESLQRTGSFKLRGALATLIGLHGARGVVAGSVTRISDRPGGLAELLAHVAAAGGNLVTVEHVREAVPLHVRQTGVELLMETRGAEHADAIVAALAATGYEVERLHGTR